MNLLTSQQLPGRIEDENALEELLTRPTPALVEFIKTVSSPLLVLGAGGKMGPTLAVLAKRAAIAAGHPVQVIAVSRFSKPEARKRLESHEVLTHSADLLKAEDLVKIPDAENIIYMVGQKFGTAQNPASTWAVNTVVPIRILERYPKSRIVALSTGNVYPLTNVIQGGSKETEPLTPLGEYANAAVARERLFQFYSGAQQTPVTLLRLFYAIEMRYGVLVDIAKKVYGNEPIELANGWFNCIWQGDANDMVLRSLSLAQSPPSIWNLCRPEIFSVREIATTLGKLLGRTPRFVGQEASNALLGNAAPLCARLGQPQVSVESMLNWIAHWVQMGGTSLDKPTHFEVRDGKY